MEYSPKGDRKRSDLVTVGLFVLGVLLFLAANLIVRYAFVFRIAGLLALSGGVYFAVRYRLTAYVYAIAGDAGGEVFTVWRDRGRRKTAECRVSLSYLRSVRRYESREAMKDAAAGHDVYSYHQSMSPTSLVLAIFESTSDRDLAVIIECDEAFERALARFAQ